MNTTPDIPDLSVVQPAYEQAANLQNLPPRLNAVTSGLTSRYEILVKLVFSHRGYRIKEIPFTFEQRKAGKTKRSLFLVALGYLVTLGRLFKFKFEAARTGR